MRRKPTKSALQKPKHQKDHSWYLATNSRLLPRRSDYQTDETGAKEVDANQDPYRSWGMMFAAGVNYDVNDNLSVNAQYTYVPVSGDEAKQLATGIGRPDSIQLITAGLTYKFGL